MSIPPIFKIGPIGPFLQLILNRPMDKHYYILKKKNKEKREQL